MSSPVQDTQKSRNKKTRKIKKMLNEEIRLGVFQETNSDTEVDLSKDVHPLSHYLNNREEMIEQMFSIISGNRLKKILPPALKCMKLEELKADCLIHLLGMSSKRILSILEGKEIDSSSESDVESSPSPKCNVAVNNTKKAKYELKQDGCSDISDLDEFDNKNDSVEIGKGIHHTDNSLGEPSDKKSTKRKKRKSHFPDIENVKKVSKADDKDEAENSTKSNESLDEKDITEDTQGKTLYEILELELRAKAIRALLNQGVEEKISTHDENQKHKEETYQINDDRTERNFGKQCLLNQENEIKDLGLVTIDLTNEGDNFKNKEDIDTDEILEKVEVNNKVSSHMSQYDTELVLANICRAKTKDDSGDESKNNSLVETKDNSDQGQSSISLDKAKSDDENKMCNTQSSIDIIENNLETETNFIDSQTETNQVVEKDETTESICESPSNSSWAERWLQSKDVNKVVSTSKMCAKIRKRMRNARLAKQNCDKNVISAEQIIDTNKVLGSVSEYQQLELQNEVYTAQTDGSLKIGEENSTNQFQEVATNVTIIENT